MCSLNVIGDFCPIGNWLHIRTIIVAIAITIKEQNAIVNTLFEWYTTISFPSQVRQVPRSMIREFTRKLQTFKDWAVMPHICECILIVFQTKQIKVCDKNCKVIAHDWLRQFDRNSKTTYKRSKWKPGLKIGCFTDYSDPNGILNVLGK